MGLADQWLKWPQTPQPGCTKNFQELSDAFVASAGGGIFRSRDGGLSWDPSNNGISEDNVRLVSMSPCFENDATAFAVGLHGHLYRTMDGGDKWQRILNQGDVLGCSRRGYDKPSEHCIDTEKDAGTESRVAHKLEGITALSLTKTELLLGTSFGLTLYSKDDGDTFSRLMQAPGRTRITCIETPGNSSLQDGAYIGTDSRGVVAVTEGGPTVSNRQPRRLKHITALSSFHNDAGRLTLLACSWRSALFYSTDDGATWTQCGNGLTKELQADEARYRAPHFNAIAIAQDNKEVSSVYVGGFNGPFRANQIGGSWRHIETLSLGTIAGLDVSSDDGKTSNIAVSTCASGLYLRRKIDSSCLPHTFGSRTMRLGPVVFSPNYSTDRTIFVASEGAVLTFNPENRDWRSARLWPSDRRSDQRVRLFDRLRNLESYLSAHFASGTIDRMRAMYKLVAVRSGMRVGHFVFPTTIAFFIQLRVRQHDLRWHQRTWPI